MNNADPGRVVRCAAAALMMSAAAIYGGAASPQLSNVGPQSAKADSLAQNDSLGTADSALFWETKGSGSTQSVEFEALGGNLPKVIENRGIPYLVTSDIYVPSGKSVRIEPGVVLLFRNFTGMHVEGRLIADGTPEKPIVFSSEFDRTFNTTSTLHANPYDWNGITIHESGIGASFSFAKVMYSVFGINSLTKYIKLDKMHFSNNGRSDLAIEGKVPIVSAQSFTYALTVDDARKDGIPVKILMDPGARKRSFFRYSGLSLFAAGCATAIWSAAKLNQDQDRLDAFSDPGINDERSNLIKNNKGDWESAKAEKNTDIGGAVVGSLLAVLGGVGFGVSFTF